jgi:hypothetical protein
MTTTEAQAVRRDAMQLTEVINNEAAILARVIRAEQDDLPAAAANALLKLSFPSQDRERMHELLVKNQEDALTDPERCELESYRRVGRLLDLLAARARGSLARQSRSD